jgi:hypothetical protein
MKQSILIGAMGLILTACQMTPSVTLMGSNKAGNVRVSTTVAGPALSK